MNGLRFISRNSPAVFLLAGAAVVLSLPPVRQALRSAASLVFHGIFAVAHDYNKKRGKAEVTYLGDQAGLPYEFAPEFPDEKLHRFRRKIKRHGRHMAVLTAAGAISIVDRTKPFVDEIQSVIQEAKAQKNAKKAEYQGVEATKSEFESELAKKIPIHPGI